MQSILSCNIIAYIKRGVKKQGYFTGAAIMFRFKINLLIIITIFWATPKLLLADAGIPVFVSILPQKYFVQQIGKRYVDVQVMVQPGASPATYEPKPAQMAAVSKAKAYFAVGVPFERTWLPKISAANSNMVVVHTDRDVPKRPMQTFAHHDRLSGADHGEGHHHSGGADPHIWLSPRLVKIQAQAIFEALQRIDPVHRAAYEINFHIFIDRIDALDRDLDRLFTKHAGDAFMVFHPSWGYFADRYGLQQVPVEIEGKAPKPAELAAMIRFARAEGIRILFAQPQFSTRSAALIAREIGGRVILIDPLAENWPDNLYRVADQFISAWK